MGTLAKQVQGQLQPGMKVSGKFEKSKKDVEVRSKGKEGSKREEVFDKRQMKGKK